jgi:hypothetical protein
MLNAESQLGVQDRERIDQVINSLLFNAVSMVRDTTWNVKPERKEVIELIKLLTAKNIVLTITPISDSDFQHP